MKLKEGYGSEKHKSMGNKMKEILAYLKEWLRYQISVFIQTKKCSREKNNWDYKQYVDA